jgi:hypothetical protein
MASPLLKTASEAAMSQVLTLTIRLSACIALTAVVACAPPGRGTGMRGVACDGGACADAAAPPRGEGPYMPVGPGERPDGPYECAPGVMCEAWQDCLDGVCIGERPMDECVENADCGRGEACVAGRCTAGEDPGCISNADCVRGTVCLDGTCVEIGHCTADADCPAGGRCLEGVCETPSTTDECASDSDCPGGERCVEGICGRPGTTGECASDSDCAMGETCVAGACTGTSGGGGGCLDEHCY